MKRTTLLAATALIAMASSGVIATAQNTPAERAESGPAAMMLDRFDTDGDGTVTRAEVDAVRAENFEAADADGDGMLNAAELTAYQEARRAERQAAMAEARLARLDADGDGMLSAEELAGAGPRGDMFDRLDADGDGAITTAEMDEARGKWNDRGAGRRGHGERFGMERGHGHDRGEGRGDGHGHGQGWMQGMPGYGLVPLYGLMPMPNYGHQPMPGHGNAPWMQQDQ